MEEAAVPHKLLNQYEMDYWYCGGDYYWLWLNSSCATRSTATSGRRSRYSRSGAHCRRSKSSRIQFKSPDIRLALCATGELGRVSNGVARRADVAQS